MSTVCGVDISHHDPCPSFHDAYNAGFILFIAKSTQGTSYVDPKFTEYMLRVNSIQGALSGCYHFGDDSSASLQAAHFLSVVGTAKLLALDWEKNVVNGEDHTMSLAQAEQFVTRVHAITGRWPLLYCAPLNMPAQVPSGSPLLNCEVWAARYGPMPDPPQGWSKWRLWQSSGDGDGPLPHDVPGIGTNVDVNRFPGTLDDCRRWYASL